MRCSKDLSGVLERQGRKKKITNLFRFQLKNDQIFATVFVQVVRILILLQRRRPKKSIGIKSSFLINRLGWTFKGKRRSSLRTASAMIEYFAAASAAALPTSFQGFFSDGVELNFTFYEPGILFLHFRWLALI